jgi:hypothetical protein
MLRQVIVKTLEGELQKEAVWSPGFFEQLEQQDPEISPTVDDMLDAVRRARQSKPARRLAPSRHLIK